MHDTNTHSGRMDRRRAESLGVVGLATVFGPRTLGEDAQAATCVLTPDSDRGAVLDRGDADAPRHHRGAAAADPVHGREREDVPADQGRRRRDLARRRRRGVLGLRRRLVGRWTRRRRCADATRYLRGHQRSDATGKAEFLTVFPGWYRAGRRTST